jgi:hypothetical protein
MTRVAVLLGAGASVDAGIPDTTEMTKRVVELASAVPKFGYTVEVSRAINYVVASLNAQETLRGSSPFESVDVERVFTAIEVLANRDSTDISAFVGTWTSASMSLGRPSSLSSLAGEIRKMILDSRFPNESQIASKLKEFVEKTVGSTDGGVFRNALAVMIDALKTILNIGNDEDVIYLSPLADLATAQVGGLTVATLNYDTTVEMMCRKVGVPCSTGISDWAATGTWDFPNDGVRLLKLHGSIDWSEDRESYSTTLGMLPQRRITDNAPDPGQFLELPAIIFGQTKLRPDGPFIELLLEFSRALDLTDHLVIVGYSFRDEHINEQLRRWLNADLTRKVTVIDPYFPESVGSFTSPDFRDLFLLSLIPKSEPRGTAEPYFPPRLTVLRSKASEALDQTLRSFS